MRQIVRAAATAALLFGAGNAPVAAADGSASADNVGIITITTDNGIAINATIPHIEATGTPLTDAELKALFAVADPRSLVERLQRLTAASITMPEIDVDENIGPIHTKIVYHDVKLTNVASGKVGAANVAKADVVASGTTAGDLTGVYGAMDARNVDLPLIARIFTQSRSADGEPLRPLYDSVTLDSFQLNNSKGYNVSVGKISAHDIAGRPMSIPLLDIAKTIKPIAPGAKPDAQQLRMLGSLMTDLFSSFRMGSIEAHDIAVTATDPKPVKFSVGRIGMSNFGDAKLGEVSYENFDMAVDDGSMKFGTLALRGLDLRNFFQTLGTAFAAGDHGFDGINPRSLLPTLDQFVLAGIVFDIPDPKGAGNADGGARTQFQLGRLELNGSNYIDGIPTAFSAALDHFAMHMPANSKDANLQQFLALGYSGIDLSARIDLAWNKAAQELSAKEISTSLAGVGNVRVEAVFDNVAKTLFASDPAVAEAAALGALLKKIDVFVENDGLAEKAIAAEASKEQKTPDQIRQTLVQAAAVGIPAALGNGPAAKTIGNAAAQFVAQPKTLHVIATSPEGLSAGDLAQIKEPAALLSKLDVAATANQ